MPKSDTSSNTKVQVDPAVEEEKARDAQVSRFHNWLLQEVLDLEDSLRSSVRFLQNTRFLAHASMAGDGDYTVGLNWGAMALDVARQQEKLDALRRYDTEIEATGCEVTLPVGVPGSALSDLAHRCWAWFEQADAERQARAEAHAQKQ